jgi:hypothetical protein
MFVLAPADSSLPFESSVHIDHVAVPIVESSSPLNPPR